MLAVVDHQQQVKYGTRANKLLRNSANKYVGTDVGGGGVLLNSLREVVNFYRYIMAIVSLNFPDMRIPPVLKNPTSNISTSIQSTR